MYDAIVRKVIFPLQQKILGGGTLRYLREWEKTQWVDGARLHEMQLEKLKRLLAHAAVSVPYYRAAFREIGFQPGDLKSIEDPGSRQVDSTGARGRIHNRGDDREDTPGQDGGFDR
jgi:hypothetical protein